MKKEDALKRIASIELEVEKLREIINQSKDDKPREISKDDKPREISEDDKSREISEFLFNIVNDSRMRIDNEILVFYKDNEWILAQDFKNSRFWIRYSSIWSVFEARYGLNNEEIQNFIKTWVEINLNWKGLTPDNHDICEHSGVEINLNWKGLTPCIGCHAKEYLGRD